MSSLRIAAVIPARLASTRMPRKVLRPIAGRPMVEWVWRAAQASGLMDPVVVATDADEVAEACRARAIPVVMTSPNCPSGSDRVREVARQIDADIYVNIQGDEPTLTPDFFPPLLELFARPEVEVSTLAVRCPPHEFTNPNAVKVVTALDGRALYFSRATIPFDRDARRLHRLSQASRHLRLSQGRAGAVCGAAAFAARESWSAWSSCGCSKTASLSMSPTRRATPSAWIRKKTWRAPKTSCAKPSTQSNNSPSSFGNIDQSKRSPTSSFPHPKSLLTALAIRQQCNRFDVDSGDTTTFIGADPGN